MPRPSVLRFHLTVIVPLLVQARGEPSQLICSHQPIRALAGDDVILPCHLETPINASCEAVEWTRPGLDEKYIYIYQDGQPVCQRQNPFYYFRTRLFVDQLKNGNVSLKLSSVTTSDTGKYKCSLPSLQTKASIQLIVASHEEESELISSDQPIIALVGHNVILPCHFEPPIDVSSKTVVWTNTDLFPKYIHYQEQAQLMCVNQNPSYKDRTALFEDELRNGNISLQLFMVKISDTGEYKCQLQTMQKEASIQLVVGAVSMPVIEVVSKNNGRVVLQCESKGWYPEPEVLWLDAEGNLLPAGPTETVRGPDGLYNVSSRVTVEKRDSNNFTCRVQQKDINQTRDAHFHVPDDFFVDHSSSDFQLAVALTAALLIIIIITTIMALISQYFSICCNADDVRRRWETLRQNSRETERKLRDHFLELLNVQRMELENQGATGEVTESEDRQRELQEEEIMDTHIE